MGELSDKLEYKRELARHLRELGLMIGRPVHRDELLSLDETKAIRSKANEVAREPVVQFEMPFDEKRTPRFVDFVQRLTRANPSDVYVWTAASNLCGVLRPVPMQIVDMGFRFDLNPEGIVAILASDLQDQLLLDYSIDDDDEQLLELEVGGRHWGCVKY